MLQAEARQNAAAKSGQPEMAEARELAWEAAVNQLKARLGPSRTKGSAKSADWKVAIATVLKSQSTVPNRWLAVRLKMGSLFTVSRLIAECRAGRRARAALQRLTAISKA